MSYSPITYFRFAQLVHTFINTNCANVGRSLPNRVLKNKTYDCLFAGKSEQSAFVYAAGSKWRYTVTKPDISGINNLATLTTTPSTTDGHFGQFLANNGVSNLNINVPKSEFVDLILNLCRFCSAKLLWVGTLGSEPPTANETTEITHNQTTLLIYNPNQTPSGVASMNTNIDYKLVEAADINTFITLLYGQILRSARCQSSEYSVTLFST